MKLLKIKICGITNLDDALAAVDMGADILGFNFYPRSPRYIEPQKVEEIVNNLPGFVDTAGIFVNAPLRDIHSINADGILNWLQFHGDEPPEFCSQFRNWSTRIIKAIRVKSANSIEHAKQYRTFAMLFDSFDPNAYGGTGKQFDWSLVEGVPQRIFLAGGINPDNVVEAIKNDVYGVDVCSGIESEPGKKDHEKMKQLFKNIYDYTVQKARL